MLFAVLIVVLVVIAWLLVEVLARSTSGRPAKPSADGSDEEWVVYYTRMAQAARRTGNDVSAATYEDLAETYRHLRDG